MATIRSRDPNIKIDFILEKLSNKDDLDFYVSSESEYQFLPYKVDVDFYNVKFSSKVDYVSIITFDLEKILGFLKKTIEHEIDEFDIESTEGDFFISLEKADDGGDLYWVSIDMSGMLFGQDFDKTEGTAISFTFLATKGQVADFYKELLNDTKEIVEDIKFLYPKEFARFSKFYEKLLKEEFEIE